MSSRCLLTSVKETLKEFRKAQAPLISSNRSSPSRQTEWSKPPLSRIKLNWDAAVDQTTKMMGSGLIARDHKGKVRGSLDSVVVEAIAAIGVEFCNKMGFSTIVMEGDAHELVTALGKANQCSSAYGSIIHDARTRLSTFQAWTVQHVRREGNNVAHSLARWAVSQQLHQTWIDSYPPFIFNTGCIERCISS
jgi:hypothetical protein